MIKKVNHIGFAVYSIDSTLEILKKNFGAIELGRKEYPDMGQISCLISVGSSRYELMEPLGDKGVIPHFLDTHKEGFHHISLLSDDLEADCAAMKAGGTIITIKTDDTFFTAPQSIGGTVYEITTRED